MSVPTIQLTGTAVTGHTINGDHVRALLAANLPTTVRLGAVLLPRHKRPVTVRLADYFNDRDLAVPSAVDYYTKAAQSIARMYMNDTYGCCVISGKFHKLGVVTGNDTDSGGIILGTDTEVTKYYRGICGHLGNDSGCIITEVLDYLVKTGMSIGGKLFKIDGYVEVTNTVRKLVEAAVYTLGGVTIGVELPSAWTSNNIWDVTNTGIVGGHDVEIVGFDNNYLYVSSWGRLYKMTWAAFLSTRWVKECYATLAPFWYGSDKFAPSGFDAAGLKKALQDIGQGKPPDDPSPTPPPGPQPPGPSPVPTLPKNFGISLGVTTPWTAAGGGKYVASGTFSISINSTAGEPLPELEPILAGTIPALQVEAFGLKLPGVKTQATPMAGDVPVDVDQLKQRFADFASGDVPMIPQGMTATDGGIPSWVLGIIRYFCKSGFNLPEPVNHLAQFLCYFVPPEGRAATNAEATNIIAILRVVCQFASLIPAPLGSILALACRFLPPAAGDGKPCAGCQ